MTESDSPFTEALKAFDPSADPYAGMDLPQLIELERRCVADDDLRGCWTVRFHFLNRLPPYRRYVLLVQYTVRAYLLMAEDRGDLPYGWGAGRAAVVDRLVEATEAESRAEGAPGLAGLTMAEAVALAGPAAERIAAAVVNNPARVDRLAAELRIPLDDQPAVRN